MDSAQSGDTKILLNSDEAAKKLAVSVSTLVQWDKFDILKPSVFKDDEVY